MLNHFKIYFLFSALFLAACTNMSSKGLLGIAKIQQNYQSKDINQPFQRNTRRKVNIAFFKSDKWLVRKTPLKDGHYHFFQNLNRKALGEITLKIADDQIDSQSMNDLALSPHEDYRYLEWPLNQLHFPVVLTHSNKSNNPEKWEYGKLAAVHNNLMQFFIEKLKRKQICDPIKEKIVNSIPLIPAEIEDGTNFRNHLGEMIASFRIKSENENTKCPEQVAPNQAGEKWYYSNAAGEILYIGNNLLFLDFNDYDEDGYSEWLFYKNIQGKESYLLFQPHQALILEKEI